MDAASAAAAIEDTDETALIECGTSKGAISIRLIRAWSPHGYDRAVSLFEGGFYDHTHFFRVVPNYLVQFGITYSDNADLKALARSTFPDDPQLNPPVPFAPGTISYAGNGPNSRTSQLFIAYKAAGNFGKELWETPIGKVINGMDHVQEFYSYGDMPPWGKGPNQGKIHAGPAYIEENFPLTDKFEKCTVVRNNPRAKINSGGDSSSDTATAKQEPTAGETLREMKLQETERRVFETVKVAMDKVESEGFSPMIVLGACLITAFMFFCVCLRIYGKSKAVKARKAV